MPAISWFSAAGHINGGVSGVFKAEAATKRPRRTCATCCSGFLAMAKMQAGSAPGMQQMVDSLQLSGEGKTVALAFTIPSEVLDALEAMAKQKQLNGR